MVGTLESSSNRQKSVFESIGESVFESIGAYSFGGGSSSSGNQKMVTCDYDDKLEMMETGGDRIKNVLVLMSDTGGGHRASAEAIRDAFKLEFGDQYRVHFLVTTIASCYICIPIN